LYKGQKGLNVEKTSFNLKWEALQRGICTFFFLFEQRQALLHSFTISHMHTQKAHM